MRILERSREYTLFISRAPPRRGQQKHTIRGGGLTSASIIPYITDLLRGLSRLFRRVVCVDNLEGRFPHQARVYGQVDDVIVVKTVPYDAIIYPSREDVANMSLTVLSFSGLFH